MQVHYDPQLFELRREVFTGESKAEIMRKMDARHVELEQEAIAERRPLPQLVHRTKIGRNAPCPCGSGRKLKKCCLDKAR
jgi:uncharacterized protein YecA (UPF0149 family)